MARVRRGLVWTLLGLALLAVLVTTLLVFLTRTERGVEAAGRYVVERLRGAVNGELEVGAIRSRGLLRGVTLVDVRITGPDGRLFLHADSARLRYRVWTLLGGDIAFTRLTLYRPDIHIERLPGVDEWNFEIIFPREEDPAAAPDNIVLIEDVTIHDGFVALRLPWEPDPTVTADDTGRWLIEEVPGGLVRTIRFADLDGRIPRILWQTPEAEGRVIHIGRLSGDAYIWDTPARVNRLQGTVTLRDSIITFDTPNVRVAESDLSALGQVVLGADFFRYDVEAAGDGLRFRDFQWLYPRLPDEGGGALRLRILTQERGNILWLARDAHLTAQGSELAGSFGVVTGDTLYFTNVDLRASPLDLELIQQVVPVELPVDGLLIGTLEVEGPLSALRTHGDLRYRSLAGGASAESSVRWSGRIDTRRPFAVGNMQADVRALDLDQLATFAPGLRLRGVASGRIRADGSLAAGLDLNGAVALDNAGERSSVGGAGWVRSEGGTPVVDLRFDAEPVMLSLLSEQYPALARVAGQAAGPVRLAGSFADLRVDADLLTPAGSLRLDGHLALNGGAPGFRATGSVEAFRLDRLVEGLPEAIVSGQFDLTGTNGSMPGPETRFVLDLSGGRVAGVDVLAGGLRGSMADGMAHIDSLALRTTLGPVRASGTFGLLEGREGTLRFTGLAETLTPLEPVLFQGPAPDDVALARPRIAGSATVTGTLTGSLASWAATAEIAGRDLIYQGLDAAFLAAEGRWAADGVEVRATVDSLRSGGRLVPQALASVRYVDDVGRVVVRAEGLDAQALEMDGAFRLAPGVLDLTLERLALGIPEASWAIRAPVTARIARSGVVVDDLVLQRTPGDARLRVAGVLPWRQPDATERLDASMTIGVDRISIGEVLGIAQSRTPLDGILTASLRLTGTALEPVLDGNVLARPFRYGAASLDSLAGDVAYRGRLLTGRLDGWLDGHAIVTASAAVPVELALTDREERLLDRPLNVRVQAHGMPAELVTFLVPELQRVEGRVDGTVALVGMAAEQPGSPARPMLEGELRLTDGAAFIEPLNARFSDILATARMGDGSRVALEAGLRGEQGTAQIRGDLDVARPSDPTFDLHGTAQRFVASRRRDVAAVADARVHLGGRYARPVISGDVRLASGELNLDEMLRQHHIVQLDTTLFQLFDATTLTYRPGARNPFLDNLVLTAFTVDADRNVWLRSRELNVEVAGSLDVAFDRQVNDIRLAGTMTALRGTYQLQVLERLPARRFEIREGTIDFAGTPGIDPNLGITAVSRVRRAQGDPLDVVANVTGTLQSPRVRLSSDSDPPVSESDIASFLIFGRSSLELSQAETDVVASMREGMLGLARPVFLGLASTQLHQAVANLGLPVDYLAVTAPEYGFGDYSQVMNTHGGLGVLQGTQVEAGFYAFRNFFVLGSFTPFSRGVGSFIETESLFHPGWGARVEWRFQPTWTMELYWEDRFTRTPSFGYDQIHDRSVRGLSLFREWGY